MSNQGRTGKIYGSCEDEGDRSGGKVENGVNRCVGGEMVMATDGWINDGCVWSEHPNRHFRDSVVYLVDAYRVHFVFLG